MRFGDRLRNLRLSREMTQQELADTLNISQSAVAAYEKNIREPNFAMIQRIADYFGVTLASMIPSERPTDEERVDRLLASSATLKLIQHAAAKRNMEYGKLVKLILGDWVINQERMQASR